MDTSRVDGVKASLHDGTPRSHWDLVVIPASEEIHQGHDPRPDARDATKPEGRPVRARRVLVQNFHQQTKEVHARVQRDNEE